MFLSRMLLACWVFLALAFPVFTTNWSLPPSNVTTSAFGFTVGEIKFSYSIAVDADGNSYSVWLELDPTKKFTVIKAAILPAGSSEWGSFTTLGGSSGLLATNALISAGPAGKAIAVWYLTNGSGATTSQTAVYQSGTWTPFTFPETNTTADSVSMNELGDAIVLLQQTLTPNNFEILAVPYTGGAWGPSTTLNTPSFSNTFPEVAFNSSGDGIAVWQQQSGSTYTVQSSILKSGIWTPALLSGNISSTGGTLLPQIAIDPFGNGTAVWNLKSDTSFTLQAASFSASLSDWSSSVQLDSTITAPLFAYNLFNQAVVMDDSGEAFAGWTVQDGDLSDIKVGRLILNGAWEVESIYQKKRPVTTLPPSLAVDAEGDVAAVWLDLDSVSGLGKIYGAFRGENADEWTIEHLYNSHINSLLQPLQWISSDAEGDMTAIWNINGILESSTLNFFSPPPSPPPPIPPLTPPRNFRGKAFKNIFPLAEECVHQLTWSPSKDPCVAGYRLYQGNKLIKTISPCGPFLVNVENVNCNKNQRYQLVAFDGSGATSKPVFVTVK